MRIVLTIAGATMGLLAGMLTILFGVLAHAENQRGHAADAAWRSQRYSNAPAPVIINVPAPVQPAPVPAPAKPSDGRFRKPSLPWRSQESGGGGVGGGVGVGSPGTLTVADGRDFGKAVAASLDAINNGDPFRQFNPPGYGGPGGARPPNATIGGLESPDKTEVVAIDLPPSLRLKNVGGKDGAGLCVFTSGNHAAFWQSVFCLQKLQQQMRALPGGGYPEKVDKCLQQFCPDIKGKYLQNTDSTLEFLRDVIDSGRMPCITYDGSLDPHYQFKHVEHMTNLVHLSDKWACVLDNNFIGDAQLVWMTPAALEWMHTSGRTRKGWAWYFTAPGPLPMPRNLRTDEGE